MTRPAIDHVGFARWVHQARNVFPNDELLGVFADWLEEQDPTSKWPNRIRKVVAEFREADDAASGLTWDEAPVAKERADAAYTALLKLTDEHLPALLQKYQPRALAG